MAITDAAGSAMPGAVGTERLHRCSARWSVGQVCISDSTLVHAWAGVWLSKIPLSMRTFG
jgi:hypothetical protein